MHYFLSRRADRLGIGTLNLPPVSSNAIRFGAVPIDGNQIMSCFVITRLQVNPPALNIRLYNPQDDEMDTRRLKFKRDVRSTQSRFYLLLSIIS